MPDAFVTLQEAASLLGVSRSTLRNWDRSGVLKAVRNPLNRYRSYRLRDVLELQKKTSLFPVEIAPEDVEQKARPLTSAEMRRALNALHRILRDCEGNSSLIERFDELTKVLFCKIHEERTGPDNGESLVFNGNLSRKDGEIASGVRRLFGRLLRKYPDLFPPKFARLHLKDSTIARLTEAMAALTFSSSTEDLKGLAYEELIRNTFDKGDNQQFFTPRPIVEFMVQMAGDKLEGKVCDPACGTGGFLGYVATYLQTNKRKPVDLYGFEVDGRLAWTSGINLALHAAPHFKVEWLEGAGSLGKNMEPYFGAFDVVITNPPFGSDLSDYSALRSFVLGKGRSSRRRGALFIERCLAILKPGGILAIIIDDAILNSPSNSDVRELICTQSDPIAIVSLPDTAFMPYATAKASILFLRKKTKRPSVRKPTFFAQAEAVGRKPNGDPLYRANGRTPGGLELDSDLPAILDRFQRFHANGKREAAINPIAFAATIPNFNESLFAKDGYRLDLAYHHPARHEAVAALQDSPYPKVALAEICALRNEAMVPSTDLQEEQIVYVGLANIEVYTGVMRPAAVAASTLKSAVRKFKGGDILFAKMRPELRKVCLVPHEIEEGFVSSECLVLIPVKKASGEWVMLPELLAVLLRTDLAYGQIVHMVTGIGRPRLSKSVVLNIKLPAPPPHQQEILLKLYQRSVEAATAMIAESEKAIATAKEMVLEARNQLIRDVLRGS